MTLNTAQYKFVQRDITVTFRKQQQAATPFWPAIAMRVPSAGADESYAWMGDLPGMREWIGERQFKQLRAAGFTLRNKHWESSLEFERTVVDDDRYAMIRPAIQQLAIESTYHPDELLFEVINAAGAAECFDGQYFFDTDHSWGSSGTQSNSITYNANTTTAPTAAEWKASLHQAIVQMLGFKNDQGKYLIRPQAEQLQNLVAVVPLSFYESAFTALNQVISVEAVYGSTTNVLMARPRLVPCAYYSGTEAWDLYYTGGILKPYVFQDREALRFQTKGFDDIEGKTLKAMTEARYNVGYLAWWTGVRTTFT